MQKDWAIHSRMSEPGSFYSVISQFPADVERLIDVVQGILIHLDWLSEYGLEINGAASRETLPVVEKLGQILAIDHSSLGRPRSPAKRSPSTCRDFALMLCSFLRSKTIPARVRCGFAAYLGNAWEDHWVCEYLDTRTNEWLLADPQIDEFFKRRYEITFDPANLPRKLFLTAGEAWRECRAGALNPDYCGHGIATGLWFVAVNAVRDHYALNNMEVSPWDTWRGATATHKMLIETNLSDYDAVARSPEQSLKAMKPFWLDSN